MKASKCRLYRDLLSMICLLGLQGILALTSPARCSWASRSSVSLRHQHRTTFLPAVPNGNDEDVAEAGTNLDELSQPSVSFSRNSLLFGSDPPSQANNAPLSLWRGTKSVLPGIVTGAWTEGAGDKSPIEHLYNLAFVRLPTVLAGLLYMKNIVEGHPLVMELWFGPFEVPSLVVFGVLAVILR